MGQRSIWRTSAGRVLTELLYGKEGITRDLDDPYFVRFNRKDMCRRLDLRKQRFLDTLDWLHDQRLLMEIIENDDRIVVRLREPGT